VCLGLVDVFLVVAKSDNHLQLPIISTDDIKKSEFLLRRAHHVLSFILHIYIHTLPPDAEIRIPAPITIPLLQVCTQLQLPPVNTYTDNVLYNWTHKLPSPSSLPTMSNLRCQTLFSGTRDEEVFYLTSTRIELRGVEALELMRATMDEVFVGDAIAVRRITAYLQAMSRIIQELTGLLLGVKEGCDPDVFYRDIRPWFRGEDSDPGKRLWTFEGLEDHPELEKPTELSGPSAGQSPLIHALDIFLGVDHYSNLPSATEKGFLARMQTYMSRHHRNFLHHLSVNPRPLRTLVLTASNPALLEAYNAALQSLKKFRDAHMVIVTLYIVLPAKRARVAALQVDKEQDRAQLQGTGGTDLVNFLKGVRDRTADAHIHPAKQNMEL
jgi:indoleamine 2,3-dioxygenase